MAVYVRQLNDGEQSGDEVIVAPHRGGQPDAELLELKRASHQDKGWTVEDTARGFHAWKTYDDAWATRKDRYFEVR